MIAFIKTFGGKDESDSRSLDIAIDIYPNPTIDLLIIRGKYASAQVFIYNISGELVREFSPDVLPKSINIRDLADGMYFIQLRDEHNQVLTTRKILKRSGI